MSTLVHALNRAFDCTSLSHLLTLLDWRACA